MSSLDLQIQTAEANLKQLLEKKKQQELEATSLKGLYARRKVVENRLEELNKYQLEYINLVSELDTLPMDPEDYKVLEPYFNKIKQYGSMDHTHSCGTSTYEYKVLELPRFLNPDNVVTSLRCDYYPSHMMGPLSLSKAQTTLIKKYKIEGKIKTYQSSYDGMM
jgi:hypothetical protein